jgi:hypothetical protein
MTYSNTWKRAHGTTVTITPTGAGASQTLNDCTVVGIPGDEVELIEKTSLGASRKEWDAADAVDSPTIEITCSWTGAASLAGVALDGAPAKVDIDLPAGLTDVSIKAHVVSDLPGNAEVGGLLTRVITIKPLGAWA